MNTDTAYTVEHMQKGLTLFAKNSVVDGMTPSQQLTNAVTRAANGDTILFEAGIY